LLCGGSRDTGVLRGMMRHLGMDCPRSDDSETSLLRRRIKDLQSRRIAASMLIDEMEREVVGLNLQLSDQVAPLAKMSGAHQINGTHHLPPDESCCLEDLIPSSSCGGQASRSEMAPWVPPGPELRCDLREQLRQAHEELAELRSEVEAAKQMGATAWESEKQVLQDSQPEASLLDGRRALLAFARGKARGTTIAEKMLDWDLRRRCIQTALFGWQTILWSRRNAHRFKAYLHSRSDNDLKEAVFSAWRHTVLQMWSGAAEQRLRRFEEILLRLSARMLAGDGRALLHLLFSQWRHLAVRLKASQEKPNFDGKEPAADIAKPQEKPKKCCANKCCCILM